MEKFKFWMVWREGTPVTKHRHQFKVEAEKEAERLAAANPGEVFFILKTVDAISARKPAPPVIERFKLVQDHIPF